MSFFSTLGNIGKAIGKVGLGAAGGVLNTVTGGATGNLINANMFDKKHDGATPQGNAVAASIAGGDTQNMAAPSLLGTITNFFDSAAGFLSGKTHVQADLHTEVGGTRDVYGNSSSGLPSWLFPVGIVAGLLLLLNSNNRR